MAAAADRERTLAMERLVAKVAAALEQLRTQITGARERPIAVVAAAERVTAIQGLAARVWLRFAIQLVR